MQTFDEKVDTAAHVAMEALGLSATMNPDTFDLIRDSIAGIAQNVVSGDEEDD